jgi:NADPH:quinone reductase-like Zn-dependent oxidoreductase
MAWPTPARATSSTGSASSRPPASTPSSPWPAATRSSAPSTSSGRTGGWRTRTASSPSRASGKTSARRPTTRVADPHEWERLFRAAQEAKLQVPIAAVYPLERAAEAHAREERGHVLGRVVLRIRESVD